MSKTLLLLIVGLALVVASVTHAAETNVSKSKIFTLERAPETPLVQFQTFGIVQTYDLDKGKGGVGASVLLNLGEYLGVEVEGYSFGKEGVFVDRGAVSLRYNILTRTRSKPYIFGGAWYNLEEQDAYGFHAGVGVSHQFAKFFIPFADCRFHKPLNGPDTATSCIARAGLSWGF